MIVLEEEAAEAESNLVSMGLLSQLANYRLVVLLHLMVDILDVTNHLNKTFQQRNISFHNIKYQVFFNLISVITTTNYMHFFPLKIQAEIKTIKYFYSVC